MKVSLLFAGILFFNLAYTQPGEVNMLRSIYSDSSFVKDDLAKGISASVSPVSFLVPASILIKGIVHKDSALIEKGIKAGVAFGLNAVASAGIKYYSDRRRPFVIYPDIFHAKTKAGDYSFPSAHTSFAFASATSLCLSFPKWYVIVPAYAWACSAGWSRMYLGVHYPSDVLMGALVGTLSSIISYKLEKWIKPRPKAK